MIKRIRIQNFRSLADVTVDLDPLTVLIGRSGTGKSNFVRAIRFLRDSINKGGFDIDAVGGASQVFHFDHQDKPLTYDVRFQMNPSGPECRYFLSRLGTGNLEESLTIGSQSVFHHADVKWITPPVGIPNPGIAKRRIMLNSIPGLQLARFAFQSLRSGIGCYDFSGDVLTGAGNEKHPDDQMYSDRAENYLLVADRIYSDREHPENWVRLAKRVNAVKNGVGHLTINAPNPDRFGVEVTSNSRIHSFDVRQESEGFRRYLAHLLALYQSPPKQTLIFEHPELGLHPGALESLAEEFKDCPEDRRGQVILTTHSPQLLDYFSAGEIRVVDISNHATKIGPLSDEQAESLRESLLHPGELLTVDPARLPGQLDEVLG